MWDKIFGGIQKIVSVYDQFYIWKMLFFVGSYRYVLSRDLLTSGKIINWMYSALNVCSESDWWGENVNLQNIIHRLFIYFAFYFYLLP